MAGKKTHEELLAEAHRCASQYAEHNKSDSFAYKRAHSSVMNGWMSEHDFTALSYNPHI